MLSALRTAITWIPVGIIISDQVATIHYTRSEEMKPVIDANTFLLISRQTRPSTLRNGQIVAVRTADGSEYVIRRIGGLPGDTISDHTTPIPPGFVHVVTDLPCQDSTSIGQVPIAMLAGRVVRKLPSGARVKAASG